MPDLHPGQITPEQFIDEIVSVQPSLTDTELNRLTEHANAWATVYYEGNVPSELKQSLKSLEVRHGLA